MSTYFHNSYSDQQTLDILIYSSNKGKDLGIFMKTEDGKNKYSHVRVEVVGGELLEKLPGNPSEVSAWRY